jgi:hypothetical protein
LGKAINDDDDDLMILTAAQTGKNVTSPNCLPPLEANICRWNYRTRLI